VKRDLGRVLLCMGGLGPPHCIRVDSRLARLSGRIQVPPKKLIEAVSICSQPVDLSLSTFAIFEHDRLIEPSRDRDKTKELPGRRRGRAEPARDNLVPAQAPDPESEQVLVDPRLIHLPVHEAPGCHKNQECRQRQIHRLNQKQVCQSRKTLLPSLDEPDADRDNAVECRQREEQGKSSLDDSNRDLEKAFPPSDLKRFKSLLPFSCQVCHRVAFRCEDHAGAGRSRRGAWRCGGRRLTTDGANPWFWAGWQLVGRQTFPVDLKAALCARLVILLVSHGKASRVRRCPPNTQDSACSSSRAVRRLRSAQRSERIERTGPRAPAGLAQIISSAFEATDRRPAEPAAQPVHAEVECGPAVTAGMRTRCARFWSRVLVEPARAESDVLPVSPSANICRTLTRQQRAGNEHLFCLQ
jgi:hypothetical protein